MQKVTMIGSPIKHFDLCVGGWSPCGVLATARDENLPRISRIERIRLMDSWKFVQFVTRNARQHFSGRLPAGEIFEQVVRLEADFFQGHFVPEPDMSE
jgi:hypothetical protein